jgi:hypothetical protein
VTDFVEGYNIFGVEGDLYVITVNLVGVMGTGVAEAFRDRYRDLYNLYRKDCRSRALKIGRPLVYQADDGKRFMMFPTKDNWRNPSQLLWVSQGLEWMVDNAGSEFPETDHIVMPPLGCGNGKLHWPVVKEAIREAMDCLPNPVTVVVPPWLIEQELTSI